MNENNPAVPAAVKSVTGMKIQTGTSSRWPVGRSWLNFQAYNASTWNSNAGPGSSVASQAAWQRHAVTPVVYEINQAPDSAANRRLVSDALAYYKQRMPAGDVFQYSSAVTCFNNNPRYVVEANISASAIDDQVFDAEFARDANRFFMRIDLADVRETLVDYYMGLMDTWRRRCLVLDNVTFGQTYGPIPAEISRTDFEAAEVALLTAVYEACRRRGRRLVVNAFAHPQHDWASFDTVVDGFSWEQPMDPRNYDDPEEVLAEILAYREQLKKRKLILLFAKAWTEEDGAPAAYARDHNARICAAAALLAKTDKDQSIFIRDVATDGSGGLPPTYEWYYWQDRLGAPLADYRVAGAVITRRFQHGTLTLDLQDEMNVEASVALG